MVGPDGKFLVEVLNSCNVNTRLVKVNHEVNSGRAIIQVSASAENAIVLDPGANMAITADNITEYMDDITSTHPISNVWVVLQNEITPAAIRQAIHTAHERGMTVAFNPAPCPPNLDKLYPLEKVDVLILNEVEAGGLYGVLVPEHVGVVDMEVVLEGVFAKLGLVKVVVITQGSNGVICKVRIKDGVESFMVKVPALGITPVDTTGAGDTFVGYFLKELSSSGGFSLENVKRSLSIASVAAAMACERKGAIPAIPSLDKVRERMQSSV
ncbi:Ribokinase-like protein [Chytridium lagenaria]|nr:Ribokinase-like protein [Chytridium lagenaria]